MTVLLFSNRAIIKKKTTVLIKVNEVINMKLLPTFADYTNCILLDYFLFLQIFHFLFGSTLILIIFLSSTVTIIIYIFLPLVNPSFSL